MMVRRAVGVVAITATTIMGTGCGSTSPEVQEQDLSTTSVEATATTSSIYELVGGGTIDLTRGASAAPIALWFWAPG